MRKTLLTWVVFLVAYLAAGTGTAWAQTYEKIQGWCENGGQTVTTDGRPSTTKVQRSYPSCTITVYDTGTTNLASIASNSGGTPKSNPFTADSDGHWEWYALDGVYDVKMSGGGLVTPITRSGYWIVTAGGGGGGGITGSGTTGRFPLFTGSTSIGNSVVDQIGTSEVKFSATGKRWNLDSGSQQVVEFTNDTGAGTVQNRLAVLTGAPSTAITASTAQTSGLIGVVVAGAGNSGSAQVVVNGRVPCDFDGSTTAGNYVGASTTLAGRCKDLGATLPTSGVQVVGRVLSTNVGAGQYAIWIFTGEQHSSSLGGSGTTNYLTYWTSANTVGASNILHDIAGQINQSGYSFDIQNGGLSELTIETDQVVFKGGVNRANNSVMQTMRAKATQTGNFQTFIGTAATTVFAVDIDGDVRPRNLNYTWPSSLPGSTQCMQVSSLGVISFTSCGTTPTGYRGATNVVVDYGCVGNGVADDTACVNAALTAAVASTGKVLYFPAGNYLIDTGTITLATNGLIIEGDGPNRTLITSRDNATALILINAASINPHSIVIQNLSLVGFGSGANNHGIYITGANTPFNIQIKNLRIDGFTGRGVYDISGMFQSRIENVVISMNSGGSNAFDLIGSNDLVLINNYVTTVADSMAAYRIHSGRPTLIGNNGVNPGSTNGSWGVFGNVLAEDGSDSYVFALLNGNNIEDFTQYGLRFKTGSYGSFYGNTILAPSSGTVTPIKMDFVDNGQRGIWDATNSINTAGASYTNSDPINSRGAPFIQLGGNSFTTYYDTNIASSMSFPYTSPQLVAGSTNIAMLTTRAQITALESSGLVGDLTGSNSFAGDAARILLQDGTAARPTYTWASDTNTGFYRAGADITGIASNGATVGTFGTSGLTLGAASSVTGALNLANSSSAFLTTIQAGNAAAARTYTWPTNFGAAGTVLTDAAGNGTLSWAVPSASLTATYVGYGNGSNALTGTSDLAYNTTTKTLTVTNGSGASSIFLTGTSDTSKVNFGAGSVPGNQGGIVFPFVGGGITTGPGIWWCSSASYASCSGLFINNGLTYQGTNSTHDHFKLAVGTGTSSSGANVWDWAPTSSLLTQTLSTSATGTAHVGDAISVTSTGTAAANFGYSQTFSLENGAGTNTLVAATSISHVWNVATAGSETGEIVFNTNLGGAGVGQAFAISGGQYYGTLWNKGNISGAVTLDFINGNSVTATLTGNVTSLAFSNLRTGGTYYIHFIQDALGPWTLTVPAALKVNGGYVISAGVNKRDLLICNATSTTQLYCSKAQDQQ